MIYALVHYPAIDFRRIDQLRSKYDPQFHLIAPHIPHVTLGMFSGKNEEYSQALKEAEQLKLDYECMLDRLHLIKINDERSQIVWSKEFLLK